LQRSSTSRQEAFWTISPVPRARSALRISSSVRGDVFMSTSEGSYSSVSMAATVSRPRGGRSAFLFTKESECLKLQYVAGYSGLTRRILIIFSLRFFSFSGFVSWVDTAEPKTVARKRPPCDVFEAVVEWPDG